MIDGADHDLVHGHFGQCVYDPESRAWLWTPEVKQIREIHAIGKTSTVVPPPEPVGDDDEDFTRLDVRSWNRTLIQRVPQLCPASELLIQTAADSRTGGAAHSRSGNHEAQCLAFGRMTDELLHRRVTVAAFPGNSSRTLLRVVQVRYQRQGWEKDKRMWLDIPLIEGESGSWDAGSPIQQIVFPEPIESDLGLLAVRTITSVFILRPAFRAHVASNRSLQEETRLDVDMLSAIPISLTGYVPIADISFNPWYPWQFATIDENGVWRVWESHVFTESDSAERLVQVYWGLSEVEQDPSDHGLLTSGCTKALWSGNATTVVMCHRGLITIVDISSKVSNTVALALPLDGGVGACLDIERDPKHPQHLIVLTNLHLMYFVVRRIDPQTTVMYLHKVFEESARVRHFRDSSDASLRMNTFVDAEGMHYTHLIKLLPV